MWKEKKRESGVLSPGLTSRAILSSDGWAVPEFLLAVAGKNGFLLLDPACALSPSLEKEQPGGGKGERSCPCQRNVPTPPGKAEQSSGASAARWFCSDKMLIKIAISLKVWL